MTLMHQTLDTTEQTNFFSKSFLFLFLECRQWSVGDERVKIRFQAEIENYRNQKEINNFFQFCYGFFCLLLLCKNAKKKYFNCFIMSLWFHVYCRGMLYIH